GITRAIVRVLADHNHPLGIATKGTLVERDIDLLAPMAERGLVRVGVSVTTLDPDVSRRMEPRVPAPTRRLRMIERLAKAGIPVRVMVSPVVPGLTDPELEALLAAARDAGARFASWVMLRLPREVSPLVREWLADAHPNRQAKVMDRLRAMHGGRDYDARWGERMRGTGPFAQLIDHRFALATRRLGLEQNAPDLRTDLFAVPPKAGDQLKLF
ncbi:MAG: radical SAM protein, partial [Pseudomonadota bacterium]